MAKRNAYDVMDLAVGKAIELLHGLNKSMISCWKQQREFSGCGLHSGALKCGLFMFKINI